MTSKTCEVCGVLAVMGVCDLREMPPVVDASGQRWRTWAKIENHWLCLQHRREARKHYRDEDS